jgi:hypothetical protein
MRGPAGGGAGSPSLDQGGGHRGAPMRGPLTVEEVCEAVGKKSG